MNNLIARFEKVASVLEDKKVPISVCDSCERTYPESWIIKNICPFCGNQHTDEETVEIHAYVDQLIDNDDGINDKLGSCWFVVPRSWAKELAIRSGYAHLDHFFSEYTYDEVDGWLHQAAKDGVLIGCGLGSSK